MFLVAAGPVLPAGGAAQPAAAPGYAVEKAHSAVDVVEATGMFDQVSTEVKGRQ